MDFKKCLFLFTSLLSLYIMYSCEHEHVVVIENPDEVIVVDTIYRSGSALVDVIIVDTSYIWKSSKTSEAVDDANLVELYTQDNRFSSRGRQDVLSTFAWTNVGDGESSYDGRALIRFNEFGLLGDVEVDSAFITLFTYTDVPYLAFTGPFGENRITVYAVIQDWEENKVNWDNQPEIVEINYAETNNISVTDDSLVVQVTDQLFTLEKGNFGFLIKNWNEDLPLSSFRFYSSDTEHESKRPYLTVYYHEK